MVGTPSDTLLECTILVRKPDPWHSFKSSYISFWVKKKPAGVTDRLIDFERLVGECEPSSGDLLVVQVKRAVLLGRDPPELLTRLLLTLIMPS